MSLQAEQRKTLEDKSLIFIELISTLFDFRGGKNWHQKVANLTRQYLNAESLILHTYFDNVVAKASQSLTLEKYEPGISQFLNQHLNTEPYWIDNSYIVSLSSECILKITWDIKPDKDFLKEHEHIFVLIKDSLKNRSSYLQDLPLSTLDMRKIEKIITSKNNLKNQINSIIKELCESLNASRCQLKIISQNGVSIYDTYLSSEYVKKGFVEAISVIPSFESNWLNKLQNQECLTLDCIQKNNLDYTSNDLESLLSIQSVCANSLIFKDKVFGFLILHQCDYKRQWHEHEICYLKEITLLLSVLVGQELENKKQGTIFDPNTNLMNSDEFLRILNHLQIESKASNSLFSLILIDIEKLNNINLKMGFVAGNLVLSQTARYLTRLYGDSHQLARFGNDEFVIILKDTDEKKARQEAEKLRKKLNNLSVLGVGTVDYNFSFVTYPAHANEVLELLTILEEAMLISKSRGKSSVCGFDEVQSGEKTKWQRLVSKAIPEVILKNSSLKTGPDILEKINKQVQEKQKNYYSADLLDSVQSLALALDAKDSYTEGHSKRVSEYAQILAKQAGMDLQEQEWVRLAALLHDIGKIGIPESILCKPAKLTNEEYEIMKKHPVIGSRILKPIKPLEKVANLVLYHHEYWNGLGYPNGISKEDIPLGSRIISIVDAYQAMTSNRPYRARLPFKEAIKRLREGKEKQWDPKLVDMFIEIVIRENDELQLA